jgi:signal transduction histidine kinase
VNAAPHQETAVTVSVASALPRLHTDRVKVKQIVGNLFRNAVRYGGRRVWVTAAPKEPECFEVCVRDDGPGIRPEELPLIFDFLERGEDARLACHGYGIGLHVVRRLVSLLGGTIEVDGGMGQGACFRVTLPLRAPDAVPPAPA